MTPFTAEQIQRWHTSHQDYLADKSSYPKSKYNESHAVHQNRIDRQRPQVQKEMSDLLHNYCSGNIDLKQFNAIFSRNTRNGSTWDTFGLSGRGGIVYINALVKHLSAMPELDTSLKTALQASSSEQDAQQHLQSLSDFMEKVIQTSSPIITRHDLQPGRTPLFVSVWWHIQDHEYWPAFYPCTRDAFTKEGIYTPTSSPIDNYFTFRKTFLELQSKLGWSSWELEHVCDWMTRRK